MNNYWTLFNLGYKNWEVFLIDRNGIMLVSKYFKESKEELNLVSFFN